MKTIVQLFLLLVISTLITGYKLPATENDPGRPVDDSDYPVYKLFENDLGSADEPYDLGSADEPFDGENDPGSA